MAATTAVKTPLPPRWFIRLAWRTHRLLYRVTSGRFGLRRPKGTRYGMMHLTAIGHKSGEPRAVVLAYLEDGADLVTLAMNGWGAPEPKWWLNLQANPEAQVDLVDGRHTVVGREAHGDERDRLWALWAKTDKKLDAYAQLRPTETAVVVLTPKQTAS